MKKNKFITASLVGLMLLMSQACKDELSKITNENAPPVDIALGSEAGILAFAKGGVYFNTFSSGVSASYFATLDDGLGEGMLSIVYGMHESMGDNIFIPWGNNNYKFMDNPTDFALDDHTVVPMPIGQSQPYEMKLRNDRAYGATNGMLPEWTYMYTLNNACNLLLSKVDDTAFGGDAETKANTLKAWAYWWKGIAYSRLGSMYIAGVITDIPYVTNGNYVTNAEILAEANTNFDKAADLLEGLETGGDFELVMSTVMPAASQSGSKYIRAGAATPEEWIHNINTMKARNLLVNTRVEDMSDADWQQVLDWTNDGIGNNEFAFVARSYNDDTKAVVGKDDGTPGLYAAIGGIDGSSTFFISERLIQDFRAGDKRLDKNFAEMGSPIVNLRGRGLGFGTRYYLIDGGLNGGDPYKDVYTYTHSSNKGVGLDDVYLAGSYEENELMKAEALIHLEQITDGLALIDGVRTRQGAGLAAIANNPAFNTEETALEEIRSERRTALFLRSVAFYDLRRMGIADDKSMGGGRANAVVLSLDADGGTVLNMAAFINYNYLSYWDVPQNDLEFNPAAPGSAVVVSPE